jgi:hypothetical protein
MKSRKQNPHKQKQPTEFKCTLKMGSFVKKVKVAGIYPRYEETMFARRGLIEFTFKLEKFDIKKKTASYVLEGIK